MPMWSSECSVWRDLLASDPDHYVVLGAEGRRTSDRSGVSLGLTGRAA